MTREVIVHQLQAAFDHSRQALVFGVTLEDGFHFQVAFPIAHVALTFDKEMIQLGYMGEPLMGDVVTIEGFFSSLKRAVNKVANVAVAPVKVALAPVKAVVPHTVQNAFNKTVNKVGQQAVHYARGAANFVAKQTLVPFKAAYDIGRGKNVLQSLKGVATQVQTVASFVPGVGTLASMGIGGITAAVEGKSLQDIAKMVAAGAVPGGPLVVAAAQTAINLAAAGVKGQNILKAARSEIINGAASLIPDPRLRSVVASAANAAASGQNVLRGAQAAVLNAALSQIPDMGAKQALQQALAGAHTASIINAAGPKLLTKVAALPDSHTGAIVGTVVNAASQAKGSMHGFFSVAHMFPAVSAHGLAAHHVATKAARNPAAYRNRAAMLARNPHPSARLMIAGLQSVAV